MKAKFLLLVLVVTLTSGAFSQDKPTTVDSHIGKLEFTQELATWRFRENQVIHTRR